MGDTVPLGLPPDRITPTANENISHPTRFWKAGGDLFGDHNRARLRLKKHLVCEGSFLVFYNAYKKRVGWDICARLDAVAQVPGATQLRRTTQGSV